jgi:hypothetical protein
MSYGFDLGRLKTSSTGMSYVDRFTHSGGTTSKSYVSPAFEFATGVVAFVMPGENIPATKVPAFPTVSASFSNLTKSISVAANGGNVSVSILVFVR